MATKAELQEHIRRLEDAFDSLMASHRDCTSGHGFNMEWAKRVEDAANRTRWGHKEFHAERWQPIETAPKDKSTILFYCPTMKRTIKMGRWVDPSEGWAVYGWKDSHGNFHEPTHWMPLPEPPKGDGDA